MVMEENNTPYRTPSPFENAHKEPIRRMSSLFSSSFTANLLRDLNRPAHRNFPPCDLPIDVRRYADGPPQLSLFREEDMAQPLPAPPHCLMSDNISDLLKKCDGFLEISMSNRFRIVARSGEDGGTGLSTNDIYDDRRQSQNHLPTPQPVRYRDPNGRYSTETRSRLLNAEERAARYALMLKSERRRSKSFGTIIRLKDETITKLHSDIKALKEEVARLKIKTKCKTE